MLVTGVGDEINFWDNGNDRLPCLHLITIVTKMSLTLSQYCPQDQVINIIFQIDLGLGQLWFSGYHQNHTDCPDATVRF